MTKTEATPDLAGCELSVLDPTACDEYLAWLLGREYAAPPEGALALHWALAHCDDGVTWGRYDRGTGVWRLGSEVAPGISPPIREESLQELRLFGETGEVLIWRGEDGLAGRELRDGVVARETGETPDPLRPSDEARVLGGNTVRSRLPHDFTHVADGAGAEQILPLSVTTEQLQGKEVRLVVRHYYEEDEETGTVRVTATRLVKLESGGRHGT